MKAAIVTGPGKSPTYGDFDDPIAAEGESLVTVRASALSQLTKARASGTHYSSSGKFPLVPGVDGVGHLADGRRVYFALPRAPFGGMAEKVVVRSRQCIEVPATLDDVTAAALANPGMSSWAAFKERAKLVRGEVVLVNGATGSAGGLAVQIAKHLGARKIIATGRNPRALQALRDLGADLTISLDQEADKLEEAFREQFASDGIDVVLDYLWGSSAEKLLIAGAKAGKEAVPIRFVQVGSASGADITLPAAVLRSSAIELMGSGIGSVPMAALLSSIREVFQAAGPAQFKLATKTVPLSQVEQAWTLEERSRIVFVTGQ